MAYDEERADRIRQVTSGLPGLTEKKMFGGIAFMVHGNMACGVRGHDLMVRVAADTAEALLAEPGARPSDMGGRPMKGWLLVGPDGHAEDGDLRRWVGRGVSYASSLPPK
ncbi:MAG TPA: TfoX/Sxy family protein [Actinomycetes bacterium]|nr:TfoX/Sxy family protein [Actinomycetes bacterium]